jgi:hypothetical protein
MIKPIIRLINIPAIFLGAFLKKFIFSKKGLK